MKEIQIKAYQCEKCGKIYTDKYLAEICCKQYHCEDCGKETEKYRILCHECAEKRRYEKAEKMTYEEYIKKYPDNPLFLDDEYYWELEDLIDNFKEGEEPKYCYGTTKERVEVNIDCAIQDAEEELPEDSYFYNTQGLYDFVEKWNKVNGQDVFYENDKLIVLIDENDWKPLFSNSEIVKGDDNIE